MSKSAAIFLGTMSFSILGTTFSADLPRPFNIVGILIVLAVTIFGCLWSTLKDGGDEELNIHISIGGVPLTLRDTLMLGTVVLWLVIWYFVREHWHPMLVAMAVIIGALHILLCAKVLWK